jgi:hypothetical protein
MRGTVSSPGAAFDGQKEAAIYPRAQQCIKGLRTSAEGLDIVYISLSFDSQLQQSELARRAK